MTRNEENLGVGFDHALIVETALQQDLLGRRRFAESVVDSLRRVGATSGLVVSVEGAWGSGKTSTLAMIEALLRSELEAYRPVVVHFNPWLIGDRDALLGQFLESLSSALRLTSNSKNGENAAKELKTYSKAFDVIKWIPGAEPWASIVKGLMDAAGVGVEAIAEHKALSIDGQRSKVEAALRDFSRPIVVFIDDIDRLYPKEVFEIIRIIKAIGDLPNVGYVVAWDAEYVNDALEKAAVPLANSYLDKIVQIRMPMPVLSSSAREVLIENAMRILDPEAFELYFPGAGDRMSMLYFSGALDLLEQPRDVVRVFNLVGRIEPMLRENIVLADIVAFSILKVKAPGVFELIRKNPQWFVGKLPGDRMNFTKNETVLDEGKAKIQKEISDSSSPLGVARTIRHLFPLTESVNGHALVNETEGHIAAPSRLMIALQLSVDAKNVDFVQVKKYLFGNTKRNEIESSISQECIYDFIESVASLAEAVSGKRVHSLSSLCMSIARFVDSPNFVSRASSRSMFSPAGHQIALNVIRRIIFATDPSQGESIANLIAFDDRSLSLANDLITDSYFISSGNRDALLQCSDDKQDPIMEHYIKNIETAAGEGRLLQTASPGTILWRLNSIAGSNCRKVFGLLKAVDANLDHFALLMLEAGIDSVKGQRYGLPENREPLLAYCDIDEFKVHARLRLEDTALTFPARAAWQAVIDEKVYYGKDGSYAKR